MGRDLNTSPAPPEKLASSLILFGALTTVGIFLLFVLLRGGGETKDIVIPRGAPLSQVAELLHQEGIISHPRNLKILLRFTGGSSRVRAGEFRFQKGVTSFSALWVLYHSDPILHQITIPEGWNIRQIAEILANENLVDETEFLTYALSKHTAEKYHINAPHLEGFLYPDTYFLSKSDSTEKIVDHMVQHFLQKYEKEFKADAKAMGFTMERLTTLASIIEKETGASGERELVSSVFHNRLKKKMRLQSDPTTVYGLPNYSGTLHKKDLQRYSAYNTYVIAALPPGPIASAGEASLRAALHPAQSNFFYFVSNNNGTHTFSETYSQHARHVNSLQVEPARRKRQEKQRGQESD